MTELPQPIALAWRLPDGTMKTTSNREDFAEGVAQYGEPAIRFYDDVAMAEMERRERTWRNHHEGVVKENKRLRRVLQDAASVEIRTAEILATAIMREVETALEDAEVSQPSERGAGYNVNIDEAALKAAIITLLKGP